MSWYYRLNLVIFIVNRRQALLFSVFMLAWPSKAVGTEAQILPLGTKVSAGSVVTTKEDERLNLIFENGTLIHLGPNTQFYFTLGRFVLQKGSCWVFCPPSAEVTPLQVGMILLEGFGLNTVGLIREDSTVQVIALGRDPRGPLRVRGTQRVLDAGQALIFKPGVAPKSLPQPQFIDLTVILQSELFRELLTTEPQLQAAPATTAELSAILAPALSALRQSLAYQQELFARGVLTRRTPS